MRKRIALLTAALIAVVLGFGAVSNASASQTTYPWDSADIKNQSLLSVDLAPNSVGSSEIKTNAVGPSEVHDLGSYDVANGSLTGLDVKDKSLTTKDLSDATIASLQGEDGTDGVDGEDGEDAQLSFQTEVSGSVNVAKIGGSFKTNASLADEITLEPGTYLINVHALFRSNSTTSGNATLQVALRDGWNGIDAFGTDYGTGFTGGSPVQADREVTTATALTPVTVTETKTLKVLVFGYDGSGQGAADSGKFDAVTTTTIIPVG